MEKINVGLIGFGVVGAGVVKAFKEKAAQLGKKVGARLVLKAICDKEFRKKRNVRADKKLFTRDVNKILGNPEIDIVVELIGGIHPAKEFILKAIKNGQHVVTANKALLAKEGDEIFEAAQRAGVDIFFEASVGGGVPIIKALREGLVSNDIDTMLGIVNGTSNYILSSMANEGLNFHDALLEAKRKGYAERNPSLDIEGVDSAHKLAILTLLGFGKAVKLEDIYVEGILDISQNDIRYAEEFGYAIKLLAIAKNVDGELEVRVHPTLLSKEHLLSNVGGVYNAIYVHGDLVGGTLFYGRGAGQNPAASSVISDIVDLARNLRFNSVGRVPIYIKNKAIKKIRKIEEIEARYYIRFSCIDKPGVLAKISGILGRHKISIASVGQKERRKARIVPVVMMTHEAKEKNMQQALEEIDRLPVIRRKTVAIRVER
ncbi:MAG: homoserine dehydrogenase [Omnitrophica WOR_2 bacterium SM23_29]|nr:MAG: homoserine dehydrogenase [Omnitrophica WOR_2 bacterium SM23_29]